MERVVAMARQGGNSDRLRASVEAIKSAPNAQVVVIGGGINGIGTFRDLALQGVEVVLLERGDFASGASGASSHMIHGGIRYLENGEFRLVRESVRERNGLLKLAPHYVKPLRTTIPIFSTFSGIMAAPLRFLTHRQGRIVERGAFLIKAGLTLYDAFSRDGGTVPRHVFRGAAASKRELPCLNANTKYTATYFDASVHEPERLALDVLMDGLASGPHARAGNYLEVVGVLDGGVRVRDRLTGQEFAIGANVIVNASGPWTDLTNEVLGDRTQYMGGTKGSHIVLDNPELLDACAGRELFFENSDGRIVLIYPLRGRVMVGTTDLEADIRQPSRCTEEEVDYFFDLVSHIFPDVTLDRSQIVFRFAGVRPLPRHDDTQPGFVSRDYRIVCTAPRELNGTSVLSLVGGKWTTFRAVAEHLTNEVLTLLGRERTVSTKGLAIGGGRGFPATHDALRTWVAAHQAGVGAARTERLLGRYGTRAKDVIAFLEEHGDRPLARTEELSEGELAYIAETEFVVHVSDILLRRTTMAFDGHVNLALIVEIARILGDIFGWSDARARDEVAETARILAEDHGVHVESASTTATTSE